MSRRVGDKDEDNANEWVASQGFTLEQTTKLRFFFAAIKYDSHADGYFRALEEESGVTPPPIEYRGVAMPEEVKKDDINIIERRQFYIDNAIGWMNEYREKKGIAIMNSEKLSHTVKCLICEAFLVGYKVSKEPWWDEE